MKSTFRLSHFKYKLPATSIAKFPIDPRNASKMMLLNKETGDIQDKKFVDIMSMIQRGDTLVLNETRVFPAKVFAIKERTNASIDVLFVRELKTEEENLWDAVVEPARKLREGNKVFFDGNKFYAEAIGNTTSGGRTLKVTCKGNVFDAIEKIGKMALPKYIDREAEDFDKKLYQTEFASNKVMPSIAPPTAGLHFTNEMLHQLEKKGVRIAYINLSIGQEIFSKVVTEDLQKYAMHHEYFEISMAAAEMINKTLKAKKNVFAVGCSVVRALESSVLTTGQVKPNRGWANKFIYPPYAFKIVTKFLTNFHPPESPSLMLTCAFGEKDNVLKAYKKAIKDNYRFHCYGDAMLIV
ncbi:MAG: tRNA preQ1(34) S-adenosylmethionine ribosyltransferase-isomerase QueA [Bacteroidetes bacterium]|nr:tRNA preQ1(34) S-adenosylmethionine ribosyltransferase-isomerase QueA [Bacteroidota bacterium]